VAENLERERALGKKRERRVTHFGFYITSYGFGFFGCGFVFASIGCGCGCRCGVWGCEFGFYGRGFFFFFLADMGCGCGCRCEFVVVCLFLPAWGVVVVTGVGFVAVGFISFFFFWSLLFGKYENGGKFWVWWEKRKKQCKRQLKTLFFNEKMGNGGKRRPL
jgi:hypothetical protein